MIIQFGICLSSLADLLDPFLLRKFVSNASLFELILQVTSFAEGSDVVRATESFTVQNYLRC